MTAPVQLPTTTEDTTACGACGHEIVAHDELGTRFCEATVSSGLTRGCICR